MESAVADDVAPKYWNAGATLRGFYDDNYAVGPSQKGSFGLEVLPNVSAHVPLKQTDIGVRYTYGLYYYENRDEIGVDPIDQTHQVDLWLDHAFNERWHANFNDTFASGQEPELLNGSGPAAVNYRINGDNISNHGNAELDTDWTRLFSTALAYNNSLFDYQQSGWKTSSEIIQYQPPGSTNTYLYNGKQVNSSYAGTLDRVEQGMALDLKWHLQPETTVYVGYKLGWVNYNGNEEIAVANIPVYTATTNYLRQVAYHSADRDNVTHYGYAGVQQDFTPNLSADARVGATYVDNYADPLYASTSWVPYANVSLTWTYLTGSYAQLGFSHDITASDQVAPDSSGHITQYNESSDLYVDVNHRITSKLKGSVVAHVQYTEYNSGAAANSTSTDYGVSLNLDYQITRHFSADAGYNYDQTTSDLAGYAYTRNRVYLGVTATY